jgi:hypothetical protein
MRREGLTELLAGIDRRVDKASSEPRIPNSE